MIKNFREYENWEILKNWNLVFDNFWTFNTQFRMYRAKM